MQLLAHNLGGELSQSETREYGPADLELSDTCTLWKNIDKTSRVWMSHGDKVSKVPTGFKVCGKTSTLAIAAMCNEERKIYALQFHPEVHHSLDGTTMLQNFLFEVANLTADWNMHNFAERVIEECREKVGDGHVICALSGGVDSTVVAVLLNKAIGHRLHCIFVNNGVLENEGEEVVKYLREHFDLNLKYVDASKLFLDKLAGIDDQKKNVKLLVIPLSTFLKKKQMQLKQVVLV